MKIHKVVYVGDDVYVFEKKKMVNDRGKKYYIVRLEGRYSWSVEQSNFNWTKEIEEKVAEFEETHKMYEQTSTGFVVYYADKRLRPGDVLSEV